MDRDRAMIFVNILYWYSQKCGYISWHCEHTEDFTNWTPNPVMKITEPIFSFLLFSPLSKIIRKNYLSNSIFMFDKSFHSIAMLMPDKYECVTKNLTYNFAMSKFSQMEK